MSCNLHDRVTYLAHQPILAGNVSTPTLIRTSRVNKNVSCMYFYMLFIGCCGRFGRGASLYRHRSQLFGRLWVRLPLPTGKFSAIQFSAYNVRRGWFITGIELVLNPTTWVHFFLMPLDSIV